MFGSILNTPLNWLNNYRKFANRSSWICWEFHYLLLNEKKCTGKKAVFLSILLSVSEEYFYFQFLALALEPIFTSPDPHFVCTCPGTHYLLAISFIAKTWYSIEASTSMHYLLLPIWVRETLTWYKLGKTTCFFIPKFYTCTVLRLSQSSLHIFYKQPFYKLLDWECWIIKELSGLIL